MTDIRIAGRRRATLLLMGTLALASLPGPSAAQQLTVSREQDITELRLGQKIFVDDGSCPTGQILEVVGATLTSEGLARTRKCVPRVRR
ncbi:DUF6719 family protein [Rhodopseudomonas telluris]|uniref:DUF6719 family protein n=1 Tax=Rhodopseudomonas telluris TaxID=644215 RepID=A0ABV6EXV1_9BRAD